LFDRSRFETHREARMAIFDYIEAFYNRKRLHSSLGYLSSAQYEQQYDPQLALAC
jgi:putative transposase